MLAKTSCCHDKAVLLFQWFRSFFGKDKACIFGTTFVLDVSVWCIFSPRRFTVHLFIMYRFHHKSLTEHKHNACTFLNSFIKR